MRSALPRRTSSKKPCAVWASPPAIAKQCGLDSLAVYTGFAPQGELEEAGATFIFRTIGEMEEFLV